MSYATWVVSVVVSVLVVINKLARQFVTVCLSRFSDCVIFCEHDHSLLPFDRWKFQDLCASCISSDSC